MNDREILAACLRWHTAHVYRLEIGAEQRCYQQTQKQRTGFGGSSLEIGERLTAAKRPELAALRALAKVCASVRGSQRQVSDADVIDVPVTVQTATRDAAPMGDDGVIGCHSMGRKVTRLTWEPLEAMKARAVRLVPDAVLWMVVNGNRESSRALFEGCIEAVPILH